MCLVLLTFMIFLRFSVLSDLFLFFCNFSARKEFYFENYQRTIIKCFLILEMLHIRHCNIRIKMLFKNIQNRKTFICYLFYFKNYIKMFLSILSKYRSQ